jgi:hypothetical protein
VQPPEVPATVAPAGVPAGSVPASKVPATKVAASGVSAPTSVLRLCGREETDYGQHNRKDARPSHKEGNSSGHGLPTPGNPFVFYSRSGAPGTLQVPMSASRQKVEVFALKKALSVARLFSTVLETQSHREGKASA